MSWFGWVHSDELIMEWRGLVGWIIGSGMMNE